MAFRIANKEPIDTEARKAVGVSLPFSGTAVFNSTYTTADQLKSNIINFFLTSPGERFMNPNFGAGIRNVIFEQIDTGNLETLREGIQEVLEEEFSEIKISDLNVYGTEDLNILKIELTYSILKFNIQDTLTVTI